MTASALGASNDAVRHFRMYIDGSWTDGQGAGTLDVENSANERVFATVPVGSRKALGYANDSHYGLSAYVYANSLRRVMELSRGLSFGELYVNRPCGELVQGFHTGWKHSGLGGEDGKYGFDGYPRKQTTYVRWS